MDCNLYGIPGDGRTYDPPNGWAPGRYPLPSFYANVQPSFAFPDPPADDLLHAELAELIQLRIHTRPGREPEILAQASHFASVFNAILQVDSAGPDALLHTQTFTYMVRSVAKFWVMHFKNRFNRPRPCQLHDEVRPMFCPGHAAYPSGHASEAYAVAFSLIAATPRYPGLHKAFLDSARKIAWNREVAGVHYRSDTEAGILLASQLVAALHTDTERNFQRDLGLAQAEMEALWGNSPPFPG
jgi:membrane-associated phospholipid phosphatase